ncbi:MAG: ATP-dependent sacrificial sulfur transferase LarE [Pirellulaceae bacterium]
MTPPDTASAPSIVALSNKLIEYFAPFDEVVVAFSGGVDSAVVAAAAQRKLGSRCTAVMAVSPSVPRRQSELAGQVAEEIGIRLKLVETDETSRPEYQRNDSQRCFYCKQTLYETIATVMNQSTGRIVCSGTNADDLGDHRPGIQAGNLAAVRTPLADLGITKSQVRQLAQLWRLSIWNLPAGPCLASRIAYGEAVTVDKLHMIDDAENWLRDEGFDEVRVRLHPGMLARIEVPPLAIPQLLTSDRQQRLSARFRSLGFKFVTVDLEGFRSGNLNQLVTLNQPSSATSVTPREDRSTNQSD